MAGVSLQTYQTNVAWGGFWNIFDTTFATDLLTWCVTALVKDRVNNVDGVPKDLGAMYLIGIPPVVDPSPGIVSVSNTFVRSQSGTEQYAEDLWSNVPWTVLS